jgi:hypothetical protein
LLINTESITGILGISFLKYPTSNGISKGDPDIIIRIILNINPT